MTNPDAWMTPQIRDALAKLEEAEVDLDTRIAKAGQLAEQLPKGGLSQEDIQLVEQHARSKEAPRELRELQERVDRGELSWQDISAGRFLDDPQVRAALERGVEGMQAAYTMIQEGHELDEIIESGGPAVPVSDGGGSTDADDHADPDEPGGHDLFRDHRAAGPSPAGDRSGSEHHPGSKHHSEGPRGDTGGEPGGGEVATGRSERRAARDGTEGASGAGGRTEDDPPDDDYFGGSLFR